MSRCPRIRSRAPAASSPVGTKVSLILLYSLQAFVSFLRGNLLT